MQEVADFADARAVPGGCVLREELALVCFEERAATDAFGRI